MAIKRISEKVTEELSITGTAAFYSETFEVGSVDGFSHQITYTGDEALDADMTVQASNDGESFGDTASTASVTGTSGTSIINVSDNNYAYARLKVIAAAGSGDFEVITVLRSNEQ